MDTLFRVVVGKEWKGKVKAFNTLRIIVKDAHFSNRVLPFIDRMFQLSLVELANARWPIRNSAMLLFASLVQRTLAESRADSSPRSKTTYSSFIRYDKARSSFMQVCERLYTTNNATYSGKVCEWLDKTLALIEDVTLYRNLLFCLPQKLAA